MPLADGLATVIKIENAIIPMGRTRPSNKGYPTREGIAQIMVGSVRYKVTAYITEGKSPFYVKVIAHKMPDGTANLKKAQSTPQGGTIIL